jgi:hypothetical protein
MGSLGLTCDQVKINFPVGTLDTVNVVLCIHLQDKVTPSTKALWPGASFQNRSY